MLLALARHPDFVDGVRALVQQREHDDDAVSTASKELPAHINHPFTPSTSSPHVFCSEEIKRKIQALNER